jgi:hypothetical protein
MRDRCYTGRGNSKWRMEATEQYHDDDKETDVEVTVHILLVKDMF